MIEDIFKSPEDLAILKNAMTNVSDRVNKITAGGKDLTWKMEKFTRKRWVRLMAPEPN